MEMKWKEFKDQFENYKNINFKKKIFNVSPESIKFCTSPSKFCDYTQFGSLKTHPHAGINRGVFKENRMGYIRLNRFSWDTKKGPEFIKLLEFIALKNHYTGKQNWKKSDFAIRNVKYIENGNIVRGFQDSQKFLNHREKTIDKLFEYIAKKGVIPFGIKDKKKSFIDNISVNITGRGEILFNNRGHHRLSVAKILKLKSVPVKITVTKDEKTLKKFIIKYDK